jgi:hypothetical protein
MGESIEYYWEIVTSEGLSFKIPPTNVDNINRKMTAKEPLVFKTATVQPWQVKSFHITDKPYNSVLLIEDVARAFGEPELNPDGSIVCKWVKRITTMDKWEKYYSKHRYYLVGSDGAMATVAMFIPVHLIDTSETSPMTADEIIKVERKRG